MEPGIAIDQIIEEENKMPELDKEDAASRGSAFSDLAHEEELKDVVYTDVVDDRFAHLIKGPSRPTTSDKYRLPTKATQSTASTDRFTNIQNLQSRLRATRLNGSPTKVNDFFNDSIKVERKTIMKEFGKMTMKNRSGFVVL